MKRVMLVMLMVLVAVEFWVFGINANAAVPDNYEYEAILDLSSKGWNSYFTGSCRDMTGNSNGEIKNGATLYVLNEAKNVKGNLIAYVYSPDLGKKCYVTSRFLKKVENASVQEEAKSIDWTTGEKISKMVEGIYMIRSRVNENACLDVQDWNSESGANCQIWSNTGAENQLFRVIKDAEGYWKIQSLFSGKYLTAKRVVEHYSIANAVFMDEDASENQQFEIVYDTEDGYFNVINRGTGFALYVALGNPADGTNVCLITENQNDAQDFAFCSVFVENDDIYENQKKSNTCTLASATMMLRKKLDILGQEYSSCTEEELYKIAWGKGLYNNFTYEGMKVTCLRIPEMTDAEKKVYLIEMLLEHPEGLAAYCKDVASGQRPHCVYLADYDPITDQFMVYDPSGYAQNELIPLEECTYKVSNKLQGVDILWYVKTK